MSDTVETAKLKLVTIVGAALLEGLIIELLASAGVSGYTLTKAAGFGLHGMSRPGLIEAGNVRIEALLAAEPARRLLGSVTRDLARRQVVAFMVDAEAVPVAHFAAVPV